MLSLKITSPAVEVSICSHLMLVFSGSGCLVQRYSGIANSMMAVLKEDTFCSN